MTDAVFRDSWGAISASGRSGRTLTAELESPNRGVPQSSMLSMGIKWTRRDTGSVPPGGLVNRGSKGTVLGEGQERAASLGASILVIVGH